MKTSASDGQVNQLLHCVVAELFAAALPPRGDRVHESAVGLRRFLAPGRGTAPAGGDTGPG
eukprot:11729663-Alexandrium_andersonii.AAC.1